MIALCSSPRFVEHRTGPHHPERPDRIRAIYRALRQANRIALDPFPDFALDLGPIDGRGINLLELTPEPADEKWLSLVHVPAHIEHVRRICRAGGGVLDQGDTPVGPASYDIALLAVGALLKCCDAVMTDHARCAFAAVRPPGHHAEPDRSMGFCLFNNIAIAARYVQQTYGVERIAIVDFDVHHGNGTQAAFEDDPTVLFISLHQHPRTLYPGSGYDFEIGEGPGRGYTMNLLLDPGAGDAEYMSLFDARVIPKLDEFRPQLLMISAGFDAHAEDPLAQINLTEEGFEQITRKLAEVAQSHCAGRIVSVLEGGYNLRALGRSVVRHIVGLATS